MSRSDIIAVTPRDRDEWLAHRTHDITASDIGALVSIHPYVTRASLWAEKNGLAAPREETPPMRRGRLLEGVAVELLGEIEPDWAIHRNVIGDGGKYFRDKANRIGATPDAMIVNPGRPGLGVLQIKNVNPFIFKKEWRTFNQSGPLVAGEIEPPLWIQLQAAIEGELTGASWAMVAALVIDHGIELHLSEVKLDRKVYDRMAKEVAEFWSLRQMPAIDPDRDQALVKAINLMDPVEDTLDLSTDNEFINAVADRVQLKSSIAVQEAELGRMEAVIRSKMGEHKRGVAGDWVISLPIVNVKEHMVRASKYRRLTIRNTFKGDSNG